MGRVLSAAIVFALTGGLVAMPLAELVERNSAEPALKQIAWSLPFLAAFAAFVAALSFSVWSKPRRLGPWRGALAALTAYVMVFAVMGVYAEYSGAAYATIAYLLVALSSLVSIFGWAIPVAGAGAGWLADCVISFRAGETEVRVD